MKSKKKVVMLMSVVIGILVVALVLPTTGLFAASQHDYAKALNLAIGFYDANRCGPNVGVDNVFEWRDACHTQDGKDVSADLTGGFHDAGDHVKFGLPQGYTASTLGWSLYEFSDTFDNSGAKAKMLSTLKIFTDYFLKSHTDENTFYYQVGEGDADHAYTGAPEVQSNNRPTQCVANSSKAASDVLGESSAALTLMYLNYKNIDRSYADKCLKAAKELYKMGTTNLGCGDGQSFYKSSGYYDDLAWAAIWLYVAEKNSSYLESAKEFITHRNLQGDDPFKHKWTMCWDDMYMAGFVKLAELTGDKVYKDAVDFNMNYWKNDKGIMTTAGGLKYLNNWGVLRYSAASSMLALITYKRTGDSSLYDFAKSQVNYMLGNNPEKRSYMIGYGNNWPTHPHHRAANGYTYANGDNQKEAKFLISGALVGGPDQNDKYIDDATQFQYTEVGLDYNAGLVGALAGIIKYSVGPTNSDVITASPTKTPTQKPTDPIHTPTPTVTQTLTPTMTPIHTMSNSSLKLQMFNGEKSNATNSIYPKFKVQNIGSSSVNLSEVTLRYYFTTDGSQTNSFWCDYAAANNSQITNKVKGSFKKLEVVKSKADIYLEVGFDSTAGILSPGATVEIQGRFAKSDWSNYSQNNDYSFNGTADTFADTASITLYVNSQLKFGLEP